jgi:hypothetical protein
VTRELPDELIVYDLTCHRAHCLNRAAAAVFRRADGTRTVAEIALCLEEGGGDQATREAIVRLALDQLAVAGILETTPHEMPHPPGVDLGTAGSPSRRQALRRLGTGVALLLPVVASVLAPTPADAQSCLTSCVGTIDPNEFDGKPCRCVPGPCDGTCSGGFCSAGC